MCDIPAQAFVHFINIAHTLFLSISVVHRQLSKPQRGGNSDETAQTDDCAGEAVVKNADNSAEDENAYDYDNARRLYRLPACP